MFPDNYSTAPSTVTTIRPFINITFGTTNVVMLNGITFGACIGVGFGDHNSLTVVPYQAQSYIWCGAKILLHLVPYPNDGVTTGNQPQNIV